jgi:hypothetical protein
MASQASNNPGQLAAAGQVIGRAIVGLGALRVLLYGLSVFAIVAAPGAETPVVYEGFGFFRTIILPTLAPLFLVGLVFDSLMSKVVMGDADEPGRRRLRLIIRANLGLGLVLLLVWLPFFMSIGDRASPAFLGG